MKQRLSHASQATIDAPTGVWEYLDPATAAAYLEIAHEGQRHTKARVVEKYTQDILADRWRLAGDPIRFDTNGRMIDGQHRCLAVIRANRTILVYVMRNVPADAIAVIDTNSVRSQYDAFVMSGRAELVGAAPGGKRLAPNTNAGLWPAMIDPFDEKGRLTRSEVIDFAERHRAAGLWTFATFGRFTRTRGVYIAPVLAAVARAWYYVVDESLAEFVAEIVTGLPKEVGPSATTANTLRNWLQQRQGHSTNQRGEIYLKTARSIQAYIHGEGLTKIYAPTQDPFPLPSLDDVEALS